MNGKVTKTHQIAFFMDANNKQKAEIEALNSRANALDNENIELREKLNKAEDSIVLLTEDTMFKGSKLKEKEEEIGILVTNFANADERANYCDRQNKELHTQLGDLNLKYEAVTSSFWGKLALKLYNKEHKT